MASSTHYPYSRPPCAVNQKDNDVWITRQMMKIEKSEQKMIKRREIQASRMPRDPTRAVIPLQAEGY